MKRKVIMAASFIVVAITLFYGGYLYYINKPTISTHRTSRNYEGNYYPTLESFRYYIYDDDSHENIYDEIAYIAVVDKEKVKMNEYYVKSKDRINIEASNGDRIVISLYSNLTIAYNWQIEKTTQKKDVVRLSDDYFMDPKYPIFQPKELVMGWDERRHNFVFETLDKGKASILLKYIANDSKKTAEELEVHINVK